MNAEIDFSLDDIEDLPSYAIPPQGRYVLSVTAERKEINGHPAFVLNYTVREVIELANDEDTPPVIGDMFSESFLLDNEFGKSFFKRAMKPYAANYGANTVSALAEAIVETTIEATVTHRKDKNDATKVYAQTKDVTIL